MLFEMLKNKRGTSPIIIRSIDTDPIDPLTPLILQGTANALLTPQDEYQRLGKNDEARREAYRALVKAHIESEKVDEIRDAPNGNFALGSKRFQQQSESTLGRRAIRGVSRRPSRQVQLDERQKELL